VKLDVFQDQVFVFTPKGEVKDLPAGATPLDFAYRIHTDIGHRCIRGQDQQPPRPAGLPAQERRHRRDRHHQADPRPRRATESEHRSHQPCPRKIRQWFKRQGAGREHHPRPGVDRTRTATAGRTSLGVVGQDRLLEIAKLYKFETLDDFYAAVGYGAVGAQQVVTKLGVVDDAQLALPPTAPPPSPARQGGVRVKGVGDLLIRFGKCCHPIPGDPIIGFITRGKGVTVHLKNCQTVLNERETARMIEVEWETDFQQTYPISIRIEAYDRTGLLSTSARWSPTTRSTSWPRTWLSRPTGRLRSGPPWRLRPWPSWPE